MASDDAGDHVGEIVLRINAVEFGHLQERGGSWPNAQNRRRSGADLKERTSPARKWPGRHFPKSRISAYDAFIAATQPYQPKATETGGKKRKGSWNRDSRRVAVSTAVIIIYTGFVSNLAQADIPVSAEPKGDRLRVQIRQ